MSAAKVAIWADSDAQILVTYRVLLGDQSDLSPGTETPNWPFPDVTYYEYTIPVFKVGTGYQDVTLCDYEGNPGATHADKVEVNPDGSVAIPAPAGLVRPSGPASTEADGHLVLYDVANHREYDFWQATTVRDGVCQSRGGGLLGSAILEAGAIDVFDVLENGTNRDTYFSARATGVPLLAGLILPEDVESGVISHALAFAIPGLRNLSDDPQEPSHADYFYPATTTEGEFYSTNPHALAAGQRIRLKETIVDENCSPIDEASLSPITRMFLAALRNYGAYLVDNAAGFTFYAEDIYTASLDMSEDEVNALIGRPAGTPLPTDKTRWQVVIEKLNRELEGIPFACGPSTSDPSQATITAANFEVIAPATVGRPAAYLPLVLSAGQP